MSGIGSRSAPTYGNSAAVPANYVAGVGRGAMGFTTRSDIGPARIAPAVPTPPVMGVPITAGIDPQFGVAPVGYVAGRGRGMGELARAQGELPGAAPPSAPGGFGRDDGEGDRGDYSESNYDEFSGYSGSLFANYGQYDDDDREADKIYASVDDAMEARRKRVRERQMLLEQQQKKNKGSLGTSGSGGVPARIADQFADLKRDLATVSAFEWESIPEVGDHSLKLKQSRKKETFMPLPDNIIASAAALRGGEITNAVDPSLLADGSTSVMMGGGYKSVVGGLAEARGTELTSKLDKMSDSISGQTVVDPKGYLTSLNSMKISSAAEIGDIKKARVLLQSVTTTNPRHGPGWIAAARVEELANKMTQARKVILQGCENCPDSEDVWIEAARLHPPDTAKAILANGASALPSSVKIWMKAADLETTDVRKKAVLRRALEYVPNSVTLWKAAIELESAADARVMLSRAVECVPTSVDMWLALAKLETHENARKVLNRAREAIPTERATWITAAKLEEAHGNGKLVGKIVEKMVASLAQYQVVIKRDEWIQEAIDCERSGAVLTCQAIVKHTIGLGVDAEDKRTTWMDDAESALTQQSPPALETARAILQVALTEFPTKKAIWQQAAMVEKEYGTTARLEAVLKDGVTHCPHAEVLWLMAAKEKWLGGLVPDARAILIEAFKANPKSEQIWLAAAKLEWENDERERARHLLGRARERVVDPPSERIWMKSALLERELCDFDRCLALLDEAIKLFPSSARLYMMAGQALDARAELALSESPSFAQYKISPIGYTGGSYWFSAPRQPLPATLPPAVLADLTRARGYFQAGLKAVPGNLPLWLLLVRLEERVKGVLRARPSLETARLKIPQSEVLWLESIRLERRAKNDKFADTLLAKALQDCPKSGLLWSEVLLHATKTQQRSKATEALKRCDGDPHVTLAVARLFERAGRIQKARKWYTRVIAMEPRLGDAHVYLFAFEYVHAFRAQLLTEGVVKRTEGEGDQGAEDGEKIMDGIDDDDDEPEPVAGSSSARVVRFADDAADSAGSSSNNGGVVEVEAIETLRKVVKGCVDNTPNRGELWCAVSKETDVRRKDTVSILMLITERVLGFDLYPAVKAAMKD